MHDIQQELEALRKQTKVERLLRGIAGTFILLSLILAYYHSYWWLAFTAFVGLNLPFSAVPNWCLMMTILRKLIK